MYAARGFQVSELFIGSNSLYGSQALNCHRRRLTFFPHLPTLLPRYCVFSFLSSIHYTGTRVNSSNTRSVHLYACLVYFLIKSFLPQSQSPTKKPVCLKTPSLQRCRIIAGTLSSNQVISNVAAQLTYLHQLRRRPTPYSNSTIPTATSCRTCNAHHSLPLSAHTCEQ